MPRGLRSILIAAALALAWFAGTAGPGQAAPQDAAAASTAKPLALGKFTKHRAHIRRKHAHSRGHALRKHAARKVSKDKDDQAATDDTPAVTTPLSPSVANAHAEMPASNNDQMLAAPPTIPSDASTLTEADKAATPSNTGVQITTSDQLNDMDRDAAATPASAPELATVALAQAPQPPVTAAGEESAWGSASLIGKIFIAFGVMLTLASAARMIIA